MKPATPLPLRRLQRPLVALMVAVLLAALLGAPAAQATCTAGTPVASLPETTPNADFLDHGDGTVTHLTSGVMWQRCALGQSWNGITCSGSATGMNWATALAAPVGNSFAGHSDWRLPTMRELASIAEFCGHSPAISTSMFPNTPSSYFWTSSTGESGVHWAWTVNFNYGNLDASYKLLAHYVRLVRGGQSLDTFDLLAPDTHPNAFSFTDQTNVPVSSERSSNTITVSGINTAANISINGGEYQINGGAWTSGSGTVNNADTVAVRHTSSGSYSSTVDTTLTIDTVSDTFSSTTLSAPTAPGAPTSVVGTPGDAQISLAFVAPVSPGTLAGGSAATITGYTADCDGHSQGGGSSPIVVSGLTNGTPYACTITATNDAPLTGPAGTAASVTPSAPTAPGAPTSAVGTPGNAQISLAFVAPSPGTLAGGSAATITGYTADCDGHSQGGTASPIVVTGLTNGSTYSCTVTATNNVPLTGPAGSAAPVSLGTAPGTLTINYVTPGIDSATVSFGGLTSTGGLSIDLYRVTCSPGSISATGTASPILVNGLLHGTTFICRAAAHNAAGWGPNSAPSYAFNTLAPGSPGVPTGVSATAKRRGAQVQFTPPVTGLPILNYTATCSATGQPTRNASGAASPLWVRNLVADLLYSCSVNATNTVGTSAESAVVTVTPLPAASIAPLLMLLD